MFDDKFIINVYKINIFYVQNVDKVCGCFIQYIIFKVVVGRLTLIRPSILNLHTIYIYILIHHTEL